MNIEHHYAWPREPFVSGSIEVRAQDQMVYVLEPQPPGRVEVEYGDEGEIVSERELTDEEYAEAMAAYERAHAKWKTTLGRVISKGPVLTLGSFETASGATARGMATEKGGVWSWHWQDWRVEHRG